MIAQDFYDGFSPDHGPYDRHDPRHWEPSERKRIFGHRHDPYVQETEKVAEIKDNFGRTRFKVILTDYDDHSLTEHDDLRGFDRRFQVEVISFCYGEHPLIIVSREFDTMPDAARFFEEMKCDYRNIVAAETKDYQDISIYAKRINYRKVCPECCANCLFGRPLTSKDCLFEEYSRHRGKLMCMNREQFRPRDEKRHDTVGHDFCPSCGSDSDFGRHEHSCERPPFPPKPGLRFTDITPEVEPFCVCDGYKPRLKDDTGSRNSVWGRDFHGSVVETIEKDQETSDEE